MKKVKKEVRVPNWQMIVLLLGHVVAFSGLTMTAASARGWTFEQMVVQYFVPSFIGCSIFAIALGLIGIGLEKRRKRILKER